MPIETSGTKEIRKARTDLGNALKHAPTLDGVLEERADAEATAKKSTPQKILKRIIRAEALAKQQLRFSSACPGKNKTERFPPSWYQELSQKHGIFDQNQITDMLIERNKKHFAGTRHAVHRPSSKIGWGTTVHRSRRTRFSGMNFHQTNLRNGRSARHNESLQQEIAPPNSVDTRITADNLRSGFNVWRVFVATSPSRQHLGYYKSISAFEGSPADDGTPHQRTHLWSPS
jgi:hypothetical protein